MARKRSSELVDALKTTPAYDLEALQRRLERIDAEHTERAKAFLAEKGLDRKPDESIGDWRKRTIEWLNKQSPWKRFGKNGIDHEND